MSSKLDELRAAQCVKVEAEAALVAASARVHQAIAAARDSGATMQAIADQVGMTRAGVLFILKREGAHVPAKQDKASKRLAELDARWERFIDQVAAAFFVDPDAQREQLRRNTANGKAAKRHARAVKTASKRGLGTVSGLVRVPTVKSDGRRAAETYALRYIDEHRTHPVIAQVVRELDEAAALREQIAASTDPVWMR